MKYTVNYRDGYIGKQHERHFVLSLLCLFSEGLRFVQENIEYARYKYLCTSTERVTARLQQKK